MRVFSERQPVTALAAIAFVVLNNVLASTIVLAAYGFDLRALGADVGTLPVRGPAVADLIRWGGLVDMVGYLAAVPVVLYVGRRLKAGSESLRRKDLIDVLTFSGLGFAVVGAIGAVLLTSEGPVLLQASSGVPVEATAARVAFAVLANGVYVGLWGTLELLLFGIWLSGVAWLVWAEGRAFAGLGIVAGAGALTYATRTGLTGQTPAVLAGPIDFLIFGAVGLLVVWMAWLAARLWLGR